MENHILKNNILWALFLFIIIFLVKELKSDVFTANVDIERLVITEKEIPNLINLYLKKAKLRTQPELIFKKLSQHFMKSKFGNVKNAEIFVSNPINAFHLIKRLTVDWKLVRSKMRTSVINGIILKHEVNKEQLQFPQFKDLRGASLALSRLQIIYNISISNIIKGEIVPGTMSLFPLTANDCFEIGRQLNTAKEYSNSILWLKEAINVWNNEETKTVSKIYTLKMLADNYYKKGNIQEAIDYIDEALEIDSKNKNALKLYKVYKSVQKNATKKASVMQKYKEALPFNKSFSDLWSKYVKLCRSEKILDNYMQIQLKCYYYTNKSPFLLLQPFKMEYVFLDPSIMVIYDLLNDREIEMLKKISTPRLRRANVIGRNGSTVVADYRISKSSWLNSKLHPMLDKINRRIEDVTGLDMAAAEDLQVVNYGIGGFYDPHFDFAVEGEIRTEQDNKLGNRIATVLLYLSDINAGGATVFPVLEIGIRPKKGSAVFWHNLLKSGDADFFTGHAACPVLVGNKWVANKWIHEHHQEFRRPCSLNKMDL